MGFACRAVSRRRCEAVASADRKGAATLQPQPHLLEAPRCRSPRKWEQAVQTLRSMEGRGHAPNVISFDGVMSTCSYYRQWSRMVSLFCVMTTSDVAPALNCYRMLLSEYEQRGSYQCEADLLRRMSEMDEDALRSLVESPELN